MDDSAENWRLEQQRRSQARRSRLLQTDPILSLLKDPLSEPTRRARRLLIGLSALLSACLFFDFVPNQVSALGITFSETDQTRILIGGLVAVVYALFNFAIYGYSDWLSVDHLLDRAEFLFSEELDAEEYASAVFITMITRDDGHPESRAQDMQILFSRAKKTFKIRRVFEFYLPLVVGISTISYATVSLVA